MQQITISLPTHLYNQLLDFSQTHQTSESQAIIQILTEHLNLFDRKKQFNLPINQSDWDSLPDDEPDEILWSFYETKPHQKLEEDDLDEPDEILSDFLDD